MSFVEDILRYFDSKVNEEYETNQVLFRMKELFCGYVVKVWKGVDFSRDDYRSLNKILLKYCFYYYNTC